MTASTLVFLLLVLACPLMMIFMMRGMHGGRGDDAEGSRAHGPQVRDMGEPQSDTPDSGDSLEELLRRRHELDREIEARAGAEQTATRPGAEP
jgi:hypothetical protein